MRTEKPTRTYTGKAYEDYREYHPAYAMIGAARVTTMTAGGGARLFGSDFRHQAYVTVTIRTASLSRTAQAEYIHGETELIEVALSEAQWATFVSSMNVGLPFMLGSENAFDTRTTYAGGPTGPCENCGIDRDQHEVIDGVLFCAASDR